MSVGAEGPGDEKDGFALSRLDIMNIITFNDHEFIHTVLGFRINFVPVVFYHVAAATDQKYPREPEKNGGHSTHFQGQAAPLYRCSQQIQSPASHQMKMEMKNDLAAAPLHIEDQSISRLGNGMFFCRFLRPYDHF
jgi:hypothetical protein